ncbi:MAG TPA: ScyD/ScyE family protein [Actinomycetes bacterium]|nr:ScyD/ScyE family protein [Actinomycetes bacterium]
MKKPQRRAQLALLAAAALTVTALLPGSTAVATPGDAGVNATIQVVASGLDTPRGVLYDRKNKRVLVAEAGLGDGSPEQIPPCGRAFGGPIYCYGPTGAVFQYSETTGAGSRIVTGLPSIDNPAAVLGVHDLSLHKGKLELLFGLSGPLRFRNELITPTTPDAVGLAQVGTVVDGTFQPYGDLVTYENVVNPEPQFEDSDPFGLLRTGNGSIVTDAAGNDVLRVKPDGSIQTLAVIHDRIIGAFVIESVPTSVVEGPDGALYIGELSGFPYPKGVARVLRLVPGQEETEYATGFTNIIDIAFDSQGRLLVLEIAKEGLFLPEDTVTGRLARVELDGTVTDLLTTGLENPGGIAVVNDNTFYITNHTTAVLDHSGELLKVTLS